MNTRQQRIRKTSRAQKGARLLVRLLVLLAVIIAIIGLVVIASRWIRTELVHGEIVRIGELDDALTVPSLVINKEYAYLADERGRFENVLLEGERVRRGSLLGHFYPDGQSNSIRIIARQSGIVCYHPDNLETRLAKVDADNYNAILFEYEPRVINDGSFHFEKGQPMFRMVDNLLPTSLVARYPSAKQVSLDDRFTVKYKGRTIGTAQCMNIKKTKGDKLLFLTMDKYNTSLMDVRKADLSLVIKSYQGIIIPLDSLCKQNGKWGVFRLVNEIVEYEPVEVVYRQDDQAVVDGLSDGDYVITTPGLVRSGDKI